MISKVEGVKNIKKNKGKTEEELKSQKKLEQKDEKQMVMKKKKKEIIYTGGVWCSGYVKVIYAFRL